MVMFNEDLGFGFLYRYEDVRYSNGVDQFDNPLPRYTLRLILREYPIVRATPKGAWINNYGDKKFVNLTANKKFACSTKDGAKESFIARKTRQIKILKAQLHQAESALTLFNPELENII